MIELQVMNRQEEENVLSLCSLTCSTQQIIIIIIHFTSGNLMSSVVVIFNREI